MRMHMCLLDSRACIQQCSHRVLSHIASTSNYCASAAMGKRAISAKAQRFAADLGDAEKTKIQR
eukprot:2270009-Lingulodinium_polyedra.AAC.1